MVTNSGSDVPNAMMVRAITRSETPIVAAINEALLTTNWLPTTSPIKPMIVIRNDLPSLYLGFSVFLDLISRLRLAITIK